MTIPRHSSLEAVVFDLDGLMFDTEVLYTETARVVLRRRHKTLSDELVHDMMGRPAHVSLEIMIRRCQLDDTVEELAAESDRVFAQLVQQQLAPMPGLLDLLQSLERCGIPRAVATSSQPQNVDPLLDQFDLQKFFTFVLTAADVERGKPDPEIYLTAAQRLDVPPDRVMVLEDSQIGCQAAISAGTHAVAVPAAHSQGQDFSGAAFVAEGLHDFRIYQALGMKK